MESKEVNLLGDYYTTPLKTKFLFWVVKYLRPFVIIFQILVVALLFSKIYLVDKLTAVNNNLQDKIAILKSLNTIETEFRTIEEKTDIYRNIKKQEYDPAHYYNNLIMASISQNIEIQSILIEKNQINMYAFSKNPSDFAYFISNLSKKDPNISLELISAEFSSENKGFIFVLNIFLQ